MISVDEALTALLEGADPLAAELVGLTDVAGRIASEDILAQITQPPFSASAMDGYAVRFKDAGRGGKLTVIGEAPAGSPFQGAVGEGQAVRIFTGGAVPDGADHIVIQEDVIRDGDVITINEGSSAPRHIRPAGIDFSAGDVLAQKGAMLNEMHGSLFAAANIARVPVVRRPKVAVFSNGDELIEPGSTLRPGEIINSNHYALCALINRWGGEAVYLGCAADSEAAIAAMFERGLDADIIVPVGGASVGDYDFVKSAFNAKDGTLSFSKVAVRPGKPTWFGRISEARVLGLPGNPASALVTAVLFLRPLIVALSGGDPRRVLEEAVLAEPVSANGPRESYLRARLEAGRVVPASNQDSSLLKPFAQADALIQRKPHADGVDAGGAVKILRLR